MPTWLAIIMKLSLANVIQKSVKALLLQSIFFIVFLSAATFLTQK